MSIGAVSSAQVQINYRAPLLEGLAEHLEGPDHGGDDQGSGGVQLSRQREPPSTDPGAWLLLSSAYKRLGM